MKKGIGAAPFAIVAALIIALAGGLWATQPAQAAEGDVVLGVTDVNDAVSNGTTFVDPGNDELSNGAPFGGGASEVRGGAAGAQALEAGYADADEDNVFRGEVISGTHWVEFHAGISDDDTDPASTNDDNTLGFLITVSGEGSLSKSSTLTSASCSPQTGSTGKCQFPVYGTGTAGDFSVTAAPASGTALTSGGDGDPATKNGQWVGPAATATAITEDPEGGATIAGTLSPAVFLSGTGTTPTAAGLGENQVGFLFQLTDAGGRVAMSTAANPRDDLRVSVVVNTGEDVTIANGLSAGTDGGGDAVAYVDIHQESTLAVLEGSGYPTQDANSLGGLVAIGLTPTVGKGSIGVITIDLGRGELFEHPFAIAGDPDADMSSVGAAGSPVNLGPGTSHKRLVSLRDANGTAVPLPANAADGQTAVAGSPDLLISAAKVTAADPIEITVGDVDAKKPGVIEITITADPAVEADDAEDPPVVASDGAAAGVYAFTVAIRDLATADDSTGKEVTKKTTDADGNPLEAHVGTAIDALAVTGVTNAAGDEILADGEVSVAAFDLITITLTATGKDGLAPINDSDVTPLSGSGFVGTASTAVEKTDDAGEVSVGYRAGTTTQALAFSANGASASLLVRIVDPDAPADTGPVIYSLSDSAVSTFHHWQGGDASSSVFENVADLVIVWKYTGSVWVGYASSPNAPGATKTDFALSDGDTLWVVTTGPVDITLD